MRPSQLFYISLKAVVMSDDKVLLMQQQNGLWEFPGGRIDPGEETMSLESVLHREIAEECGPDFQIQIGQILRAWVSLYSDGMHGLIVEHLCQYHGGDVVISEEHNDYRWMGRNEWQQLPLAGGNVDGVGKTLTTLWDKPYGNT